MPDLGGLAHQRVPAPGRPEYDEAAIVRRAQLGSPTAFDQLVKRRGPDLYRYLVIRLRNESDARDALQETVIAAWKALPSLKQPGRFWPWVVTIAARKAIAIARARVPQHDHEVELLEHGDESLLEIWDAISNLPPHHREVIILRYRFQLTEREAAQALGVRVSTVKSRTFLARKALRELLT